MNEAFHMSDEQKQEHENVGDSFLQYLINLTNLLNIEIRITLNVSGFLVSGSIVSGAKYFEGFGKDFSSMHSPSDDPERLKDYFSKFSEIYTQSIEEDKEIPSQDYIHLKNAIFINAAGSSVNSLPGVWWRGRTSEVSGFTLGNPSANQA
jgi:predicted hydrocarbon binding protein